jgi:hypothetical protein
MKIPQTGKVPPFEILPGPDKPSRPCRFKAGDYVAPPFRSQVKRIDWDPEADVDFESEPLRSHGAWIVSLKDGNYGGDDRFEHARERIALVDAPKLQITKELFDDIIGKE